MSKYNWKEIQDFYDLGNSFRKITKEFGAANETINKAVREGLLKSRDQRVAVSTASKNRPEKTSYRNVKVWRQNTKARLVAGYGGKCATCGVVDHPIVYDMHHLDPAEKDFGFGQIRSWENLVAEASKCVLLCSPCHRKVHAHMIAIPADVQRFDEALCGSP